MLRMKRIDPSRIRTHLFWAKVDKLGPDDCWLWTGAKLSTGYGTFTIDDRTYNATHVALTLDGREREVGEDGRPWNVLHGDCSNPSCVNPAHLRWGTQKENIADKRRLGRFGLTGPKPKISDEQVAAIRADPRTSPHVAKDYGITPSHVRHIRRGVTRTRLRDD